MEKGLFSPDAEKTTDGKRVCCREHGEAAYIPCSGCPAFSGENDVDANDPSVVFNEQSRVVRVGAMDDGTVCIQRTKYGDEFKTFGWDSGIELDRDEAIAVAKALVRILPTLDEGGTT